MPISQYYPNGTTDQVQNFSAIAIQKLSALGHRHFLMSVETSFAQLLRHDPSLRLAEAYDPLKIEDILSGQASPLYPEDHPWCGAICLHAQAIAIALGMNVGEVFMPSALDPNHVGDEAINGVMPLFQSAVNGFTHLTDPEKNAEMSFFPEVEVLDIFRVALSCPDYSGGEVLFPTKEQVRSVITFIDHAFFDDDRGDPNTMPQGEVKDRFRRACHTLMQARKDGPNSPLFIFL